MLYSNIFRIQPYQVSNFEYRFWQPLHIGHGLVPLLCLQHLAPQMLVDLLHSLCMTVTVVLGGVAGGVAHGAKVGARPRPLAGVAVL